MTEKLQLVNAAKIHWRKAWNFPKETKAKNTATKYVARADCYQYVTL